MGVPLFFGWLRNRYPVIVEPIHDVVAAAAPGEHGLSCSGSKKDLRSDNLYLDMNGIIHQCSHPIDRPAPETEEGACVRQCA